MTLQSRLADLVAAVGADIKDLRSKAIIPLVSALPLTPTDGLVVDFQTAAMAIDGVMWRLRYRDAADKPYKWSFLGGPPMYANIDTGESVGNSAYVDLATPGPRITTPLAGDYQVSLGGNLYPAVNGGAQAWMSFVFSAAAAADVDGLAVTTPGIGLLPVSMTTTRRKSIAAGFAVTAKYRSDVAGNQMSARYRWLSLLPVRVG